MQALLKTIASILIAPIIYVASIAGYDIKKTSDVPNVPVAVEAPQQNPQLGADSNLFFGGFPYYLAGSGLTSSASSFTLTSLTLPQNSYPIQDSDLSSTFYITFEPGNKTRQEFASCTTVGSNTGGNVTISGCTRGLSAITPYTASTTQRFSHAGGTAVIFSNSPSFYDKLASLDNAEAVTGLWTFNTLLPTSSLVATTSTQFVTKSLLDSTANAGAATSTESTTGIVRLATALQQASSTASTVNTGLCMQPQYATSTPSGTSDNGLFTAVAKNNGKLHQLWLDLTEAFTFTGDVSLSATNSSGGLSPVGSIQAYATTTAPTGWMLADGTAINRTTYANLYAVIGTSYGVGNGSTTFNLPNLSGRTIIMATSTQTYADVLGETGGATSTVLTIDQLAAHSHFMTGSNGGAWIAKASANILGTTGDSTSSTGSNEGHSNLDPYIVLNYIIKY